VRSVRAAFFQMEQELMSVLSTELRRRDTRGDRNVNTPDERFTLAELGDWLKTSRTTAYRLVREKHIPAYRIGRATRVRRSDVERWLEEEGRTY
jgi:excisionase family DNA binding protein